MRLITELVTMVFGVMVFFLVLIAIFVRVI